MDKNKKCDLSFVRRFLENISSDGQDILFSMLEVNPVKRLSAKQALEHRWFKKDNVMIKELLQVNSLVSRDISPIPNRRKKYKTYGAI